MRFRLPAATALAGLTAAAIATSALVPSQASAAELSLRDQVLTDARTSILAMATKNSETDTQFLANGRFTYTGSSTCPRCEVGPAVAAAALYRRTGDPTMLTLATTVFDAAIRDQILPDGSFGQGAPGEGGNGIQTLFFAQHLGAALSYLGTDLDAARGSTYTAALTRAADWLATQGLLTWYVNGNINLAVSVVMGMAWKQTGMVKYQTYYDKALTFTLAPAGTQWAAFGLRVTSSGSLSLGRDTAAYLVEKGPGGAGFDADYSQFQADIAAQGYQVIGDPRLLTLVNQLNNQLLTRTNLSTWALDVTAGTRNPARIGFDQYQSPAFYLSAVNGRPEIQAQADAQVRAATQVMRQSATQAWAGIYQAWGTRFAVDVMAVQ